jgi:F0F1-type ATP synthase assembly protein I
MTSTPGRPTQSPRQEPEDGPSGPSRSTVANQAKAWGIGLNFAYGVAGFALIGWALQKWVWPNAAPWLMIALILLGVLGGGVRFVREAIAMGNASSPRRKR